MSRITVILFEIMLKLLSRFLKELTLFFCKKLCYVKVIFFILNDLNEEFDNVAFVRDREAEGIFEGRPSRGVAIFWKQTLTNCITPILINDSLIGIVLANGDSKILLMNVYLPCDFQTFDALDEYRHMLAQLKVVIYEQNINSVLLAGDFNSDPSKGRFWKELLIFKQSLSLVDLDDKFPGDSFTYLCPTKNTTSWLDHILCSKHIKQLVTNVYIDYNAALFDHFPLHFNLEFALTVSERNMNDELIRNMVYWNKLTDVNKAAICSSIDDAICNKGTLYHEVFSCTTLMCSNESHLQCLDNIFDTIKCIMLDSTTEYTHANKKKHKVVPGWNDHVRQFYCKARHDFLLWKENGKPLSGSFVDNMKNSRSQFKAALRKCKINEELIRKEKLLGNLNNKDYKEFWTDVNKEKKHNQIQPKVIDGLSDPLAMCQVFSKKYMNIFAKDVSNAKQYPKVTPSMNDGKITNYRFSKKDVGEAMSFLKPGIGMDGIHTNHLKLSPDSCTELISELFSCYILHNYIPINMLKGTINPTVKDKFGDLNSSDNYRPIMSSSVFLKLFEYCLLKKLNPYIKMNDRQHGYRPKYSTGTACFVLKETVLNYLKSNSDVYACFVDVKKAFDSVNHVKLFNRLSTCGVPNIYIGVIQHWYKNQFVNVRFKKCL